MKKSLLLSLAVIASLSASSQKVIWDFSSHGVCGTSSAAAANLELIDKYGQDKDKNPLMDATKETELEDPYMNQHGIPNRVVSLYDGKTYAITPDESWAAGTLSNPIQFIPGDEIEPGVFTDDQYIPLGEVYADSLLHSPYICWMEKTPENKYYGPARMIYYPAYGTLDAWTDANYNAVDEATWIANKGALSWIKSGQGKKPIAGTYVQFPEVQGPCKVTYYVGSTEASLTCSIIPVVNGVALDDKAGTISEDVVAKRYYKKEFTYAGEDKVALRIMSDGCGLLVHYVEIDASSSSAIENIIVDAENENAPVYNIMGIQVDENYKGVVIKNGKKYIQK